jgi:hypothetical protein
VADTIGDLIDKLTISNIRLWHVEDARREYCGGDNKDEEKARGYLDMVSKVNKERNGLIDQINAALKVLIDSSTTTDSYFRITAEELLGVGKNKFYKEENNGK